MVILSHTPRSYTGPRGAMKPKKGRGDALRGYVLIVSSDGQVCRSLRQVGSSMQKINDDYLLGILNQNHEVLVAVGKAQFPWQVLVNEALAVPLAMSMQVAIRPSSQAAA